MKSVVSLFVLLLVFLVTLLPAEGQDLSGFQKILLPAYTSQSIEGANGSTFSTVLTGYTDVDTTLFAVAAGPDEPTPVLAIQPAMNPIFTALDYGPPRPTGRFLYVEAVNSDELSLQYFLLSSDAYGDTADQMTALPIVNRPLARKSRILRIPVRPIIEYEGDNLTGRHTGYVYRLLLRIYDWEGDGTGRVTVTPYVEGLFGESGALESSVATLDRRDGDDPTFPWYAELPLDRCLPFSAHTPCMSFNMRVEIIPETDGMEYWPFVSVTDNRTQQVTVFAPRHQ